MQTPIRWDLVCSTARPLGLLLGWLTGSKLPQCGEAWHHLLYRPDYEYCMARRDRLAKSDNHIIKAVLAADTAQFYWEGPEFFESE